VILAKMKDLLKAHIPKKNTLDSYCRTMEQVYGYFKVEDIHELFKSKIEHYAYEQKISQDEYKELNKKTTQEGDAIIEYFGKKKLN
jgi:D-hexose-6-phosphate mutarotase